MTKLKFIFSGIAVLAIAAAVAFNVNINTQKSNLSPLSLANIEALAGESTTNPVWNRNDQDCVYRVTGKVGSTVTILGGINLVINAEGWAEYKCGNCKTECSLGGPQQCTARYCQSII